MSTYKAGLLTGVRATHFARLMILFTGCFVDEQLIVHEGWPLTAIYFLFFLADFVPFSLFWFLRTDWEFSVRTIGLLWVIILMTQFPLVGEGIGLFTVLSMQFIVLVWPKWYIPTPEQEGSAETEGLVQIKCTFCGALYAYMSDSIIDGKVSCQNCGKSISV